METIIDRIDHILATIAQAPATPGVEDVQYYFRDGTIDILERGLKAYREAIIVNGHDIAHVGYIAIIGYVLMDYPDFAQYAIARRVYWLGNNLNTFSTLARCRQEVHRAMQQGEKRFELPKVLPVLERIPECYDEAWYPIPSLLHPHMKWLDCYLDKYEIKLEAHRESLESEVLSLYFLTCAACERFDEMPPR